MKEQIHRDVLEFPPLLRKLGLSYLRERHLLPHDTPVIGIPLYLPYWLADAFNFENKESVCNALSMGSLYITLSVEIKDYIMDNPKADLNFLCLSDAFLNRSIRLYQSLFSHESEFWGLFEQYMQELYRFIIWEKGKPFLRIDPLSDKSLMLIKKQTSFLKPTAAALTLLGNAKHQINRLSNMLEHYHIALKLVDDFVDWEDDLIKENVTSFLCLALNWLGKPTLKSVTHDEINRYILDSSTVQLLFEKSIYHITLAKKNIKNINCPYMIDFLDFNYAAYIRMRDDVGRKQHVFHSLVKILNDNSNLLNNRL